MRVYVKGFEIDSYRLEGPMWHPGTGLEEPVLQRQTRDVRASHYSHAGTGIELCTRKFQRSFHEERLGLQRTLLNRVSAFRVCTGLGCSPKMICYLCSNI